MANDLQALISGAVAAASDVVTVTSAAISSGINALWNQVNPVLQIVVMGWRAQITGDITRLASYEQALTDYWQQIVNEPWSAISEVDKQNVDSVYNGIEADFATLNALAANTAWGLSDILHSEYGLLGVAEDRIFGGTTPVDVPGIDAVVTALENTVNGIKSDLTNAWNFISGIVSTIDTVLGSAIPDAVESFLSFIGNTLNLFTTGVEVLARTAISINSIIGQGDTAELLTRDLPSALSAIKAARPDLEHPHASDTNPGIKAAVGTLGAVGLITGAPLGFAPVLQDAYSGGIGAWVTRAAKETFKPNVVSTEAAAKSIWRGITSLDRLYHYSEAEGLDNDSAQIIFELSRSLFDVDQVITLRRLGFIDDGMMQQKFKDLGYSQEDISLLLALVPRLLDVGSIIQLELRGSIEPAEAEVRLNQLGYSDADVALLRGLAMVIPNVNDLIRMAVREAFTPEIAQQFGQYEEIPTDVYPYLAQQGLSKEWFNRYWAAHWELPGAGQGFAMYQRTTSTPSAPDSEAITYNGETVGYRVINTATLATLLHALDVMPYWRDKLTQIAFNPLTRVDVRRMHKLGIMTEGQVYRAFTDEGYSPEHSLLMTQFTIAMNTEQTKVDHAQTRDLTKAEVISAYRAGAMTRDDSAFALLALQYDADEAELLLNLADLAEFNENRKTVLENTKLRYQKGLIDYNHLQTELGKLNLSTTEIDNYSLKWEQSKPVASKYPTIEQLDGFLKQKLITLGEYRTELSRMGFTQFWIDKFTALVGVKYGIATQSA